jgi:hypothetical protein
MQYSTKELSPTTWRVFENLFLRKSAGDGGWCMIFHQPGRLPKAKSGGMTLSRVTKSRRDKRIFVEGGTPHGILVYANAKPVGRCQYGSREELPRVEAGTIYKRLALGHSGQRLWRITCFWVDRLHCTRGVASTALTAALEPIGRPEGGPAAACPAKVKGFPADWFDTWSILRKRGFEVVPPYRKFNVLLRRTVKRRRRPIAGGAERRGRTA